MKTMLKFVVYSIVAIGVIAGLTGCETGRALYHACRDGLCG